MPPSVNSAEKEAKIQAIGSSLRLVTSSARTVGDQSSEEADLETSDCHIEPKASRTAAANTLITDRRREEWPPSSSAAFAKPLGGLILPSINNLKGMGGEEDAAKEAESTPTQKEPIQNLLQDLSSQEKLILKQIFISNKIGERTATHLWFCQILKYFIS
jgi:hypothetical protein